MTAHEALEIWGLRVSGGSLKSPGMRERINGSESVDDELALMRYVESTDGFFEARPVLLHKFANGLPIETFQMRGPGETRFLALHRLRWLPYVDEADRDIPQQVVDDFTWSLDRRLIDHPFVPPSKLLEEHDAGEGPCEHYTIGAPKLRKQ